MTETNSKRVLGIVGSPRRGGNTEILVDEVLRGAKEAGAQVEKVILSKLEIGPCRGCDACKKVGKCTQQDDMHALLEQMEHSQVWVLGTPVYWWGATAQFKAFLDRWYGVQDRTMFVGRRTILIIPLEDTENTARHTVGMFQDVLNYLKMEHLFTVVAPGVLDRGAVREHPGILAAAYQAGQKAIID
ncbi:MAG: flavodoxin family protein [Chloroflexi bacterium]|nr:flavodoxin family protein [Chloroflexota bacterium]